MVKRIGLISDSIGQGYYACDNGGWFVKLIEKLNKDNPRFYSYYNSALSGDRITDAYYRANDLLTREIDTVFIHIGVNDLIRWDSKDSPTDISDGLMDEMWDKLLNLLNNNIKNVYIVSVLPVIEEKFPEKGFNNRPLYTLLSDIENYNSKLEEYSKKYNVKFIDIYEEFNSNNLNDLMFDASHPNDKGHALIADLIYKKLEHF